MNRRTITCIAIIITALLAINGFSGKAAETTTTTEPLEENTEANDETFSDEL